MADRDLTAKPDEPRAVDLWDRTEPRSILNLVPPAVQAAMLNAGASHGEYFGLDERALFKLLRTEAKEPGQTDNQLRYKFWFEYEASLAEHRDMNMTRVYAGICHRSYFYEKILARPEKVAWMVTPILDYALKLEEAVSYGNERMRDILEIDPATYPPGTRIKLMELQAKVFSMLDARKYGAFTQKVEQKNMNLNVSTSDKAVAQQLVGSNMESLQRRIKELESRERNALNLPAQGPGATPEVLPAEDD
jgi:hypothetical protein